jgi:hypothetical protein
VSRDQSSPQQRFVRAMINEAMLLGDTHPTFRLSIKSIVPIHFCW